MDISGQPVIEKTTVQMWPERGALLKNNELEKKGTTCHGWGVNWYWYIVHPVITVRSTAKLCVPGFHDVVNAKKSRWFMALGLQFSSPQWIISPHLTGHPGLLQFIPGIGPITATTNCDNWVWIQVIAVQFHHFAIFYQVVYPFPIVPALVSQEWLGYTLGGWPYLVSKCSDSYGLNYGWFSYIWSIILQYELMYEWIYHEIIFIYIYTAKSRLILQYCIYIYVYSFKKRTSPISQFGRSTHHRW